MTRISSLQKRFFLTALAVVITGHVLLFYGISLQFVGILFGVLTLVMIVLGGVNALILSLSLVLTTVLFWGYLGVSGKADEMYYRLHERHAIYDAKMGTHRYENNVHVTMDVPHGDLHAIDPRVTPSARATEFMTDNLGFRNREDYHGQPCAIVGDSFVVGSGMSQEDTLPAQLRDDYGIDCYSLAYPTRYVWEYDKLIERFDAAETGRPRFLLFLFEGNDFPSASVQPAPPPGFWERYRAPFRRSTVYRFTFSRLQAAIRQPTSTETSRVFVGLIRDMEIAFLRSYVTVSRRKAYEPHPLLEDFLSRNAGRIDRIFLIPVKYRVYHHLFDSLEGRTWRRPPLPAAQWDYVKKAGRQHGIPVTDLTPVLVNEAALALKKDELIFWSDDTHWNERGIAAASRAVAFVLGAWKPPAADAE